MKAETRNSLFKVIATFIAALVGVLTGANAATLL
jgi:hypothetical protein